MQVGHDFRRRGVLHRHILHLLVLVDGQIIAVGGDLRLGHQERLLGAGAVLFLRQIMEPLDNIGDVILLGFGALVIQREAVGLHVIEPDVVGAAMAGLGKHQNGGGHPCIGLENAAGHRNHRLQAVVFDDFLADGLVGGGGTEQHAVRHDAGAPAANLEHPEKQSQEQQLGLFGFAELEQVS